MTLSKPASVDPGGYVRWDERIIISVPTPDGSDFSLLNTDDDGGPYDPLRKDPRFAQVLGEE